VNTKSVLYSLTVISSSFCLVLATAAASAADKADAKDKIKDLQKQRLKALTTARDYLVKQWKSDDLVTEVNTNGFLNQMLDTHKLVFQARLDLCDTTADRIKALEESIKDFEPVQAVFEKHFKAGIVDSTVPYHLGQAYLLELQIALEKAKQGSGAP
jgi:hypothetical protein